MQRKPKRRDLLLYGASLSAGALIPTESHAGIFACLRARRRSRQSQQRVCPSDASHTPPCQAAATFTWEDVATDLAKALLSYLATKTFEQVQAGGVDQQERLMIAVRDILAGQDRSRMNSAISWHRTAMDQVLLFRGDRTREQRLINAEEKSTYAKNELQGIGFMAREPWFIAAELRLSIAQEWHNINPGSSQQQAIEREIGSMRQYFRECERADLALAYCHDGSGIERNCIRKITDFPNPGDVFYDSTSIFDPLPEIKKRVEFLNLAEDKITDFERVLT